MIVTRQDETATGTAAAERPSLRDRVVPTMMTWTGPAIPLIILLVMGYRQRWVSEDAFISLRVVEQILSGNGPVYNESERVEAYTHPLWVALLTIWGALGLPTPLGAVILGIAATLAGLAFAMAASNRLVAQVDNESTPGDSLLIPVGALIVAVIPVVWDFVTSGLETGLTFAWFGVAYWLLVRASLERGQRQTLLAAVAIGLGPLVRPDLAIFAGIFLLCLLVSTSGRSWTAVVKHTVILGAAAGAVPAIYQIFRMGYFATLVPNTALAKEAGDARWEQGWIYLRDFTDSYHLWLPLLIAAGFALLAAQTAWQRSDRITLLLLGAPILAGLLHAIYVVRVGGDFMHGRFLLPTLFGMLLPVMVVRVPLSLTLAPRHLAASAALVVLAGWSVIAAVSLRIPYEEAVSEDGLADERGVYVVLSGHHNPIELDDYMTMSLGWPQEGASWHQLAENDPRALLIEDERYPLDPTIDATIRLAVLTWNIGLSGYAAGIDVHVADRYGLADPLASRMRLEVRGRPGHEKQLDPIWAIARFGSATDATGDVVAARTALACGDIAEQLAAIEEPLTTGRFLDNFFVALRLRDLSIPSDPEAAIAEYC